MNKILQVLYGLLKIKKLKRIDKFFDDLSDKEFDEYVEQYYREVNNDE